VPETEPLPERARVVVVGAGIVGCCAAYHLGQLGWTDVVVLDQGPLFRTGGSTSHAPGLVFQNNTAPTTCRFAMASVDLYRELELDGEPVYAQVGSLEVASTPERWADLKRKAGLAASWGLEAHLVRPDEVRRLVPPMRTERLYGAIHVPGDGVLRAVAAAQAVADRARATGAAFHGRTGVTGIEVEGGRVRAVVTERGRIETEHVLCAAGIWGPLVGRLAGVAIPLQPLQHLYAVTEPVPELGGSGGWIEQPIVRHQDRSLYLRQVGQAYGIGAYRHEPALVEPEQIRPYEQGAPLPSCAAFDEERFAPSRGYAAELLPCLKDVRLAERVNGMFSFTPDGHSLIGESADVRGFWACEAVWVTHAAGAARAVAEWMVEGTSRLDLHEEDLNRFAPHALTRSYVRTRAAQNYREVYDIIHPLQQVARPRNQRLSPFHARLQQLGGVFFESAGWERPQWFEANGPLPEGADFPLRTGWAARNWSPIQGLEHLTARQRVVLFDLTAFAKLDVWGPGALAFLQGITANQMDRPPGRVTYTAMLDERGGIQADLTVTRLAEDRFRVLTGGSVGGHDAAWIRRHLPADGRVRLTDVTSSLCALGLWGPRARDLLAAVCEDDLSDAAFPYLSARPITIDTIPALALRISYVGELGWEVYAATEHGPRLWDVLWEAGRPLGLRAIGGGAFDSLRLEKGYRLWGTDIHGEFDPYEAGLGFAVRLGKGDFLGREALLRARERGLSRKLCCLAFDDPSVAVLGREPILAGGRVVGHVTSANYGYSVRRSIAYGYLPVEHAEEGARVEVEWFGRRHPASVVPEPLFDPQMHRLKGTQPAPVGRP
jgi:glycine cleavage system aminomethyltransferase T/glycine/D-amino acid oxidase-like deaminating enzyme